MTPIGQLPGFDESLRLLIERERYSLTDIAMMFGVSRERVRQLCATRGLTLPDGRMVGLYCIRVWDDSANRFEPVSRRVLTHQSEVIRQAHVRGAREQRQAERRGRIVDTLNALRANLQREPSWGEWAAALGWKGNPAASCRYVLGKWNGKRGSGVAARQELCDTTGYTPRASGTPGHLHQRARQTHCRRCGTELRMTPRGSRYCPNGHKAWHRALTSSALRETE